MADMDSWCPSCGYSIDPATRFCGGCGQQLDGSGQSSTVTMKSPPAPFPGYAAPAAMPVLETERDGMLEHLTQSVVLGRSRAGLADLVRNEPA